MRNALYGYMEADVLPLNYSRLSNSINCNLERLVAATFEPFTTYLHIIRRKLPRELKFQYLEFCKPRWTNPATAADCHRHSADLQNRFISGDGVRLGLVINPLQLTGRLEDLHGQRLVSITVLGLNSPGIQGCVGQTGHRGNVA